ncbi:MAG: N-acetylglucosamine kinase, partial [Bacteroidetes bacterium]|nr:N-acetylglucosamine kinase [Bacteroidota bacterium]
MAYLIADSGSTKCEWCLVNGNRKTTIITTGINPYFISKQDIVLLLQQSLLTNIKAPIDAVYFYGTGLGNAENVKIIKAVLKQLFATAAIDVQTDLVGAARSLLQH